MTRRDAEPPPEVFEFRCLCPRCHSDRHVADKVWKTDEYAKRHRRICNDCGLVFMLNIEWRPESGISADG